jgi:hypothetical protein
MRRALAAALLLALAGCGSDDGDGSIPPTISTPPPPVILPLNGVYDLVIVPAAECGFPDVPLSMGLNVTSFATSAGNELRGTLLSGASTLALDMLYPAPGQLEGGLSTVQDGALLDQGGRIYLRNNGRGLVSLSDDARPEVLDGVMVGEVTWLPDGANAFPCASTRHSWSLVAR